MHQESDDHQRHDDTFLDEGVSQRSDRTVDQHGAVIGDSVGDPLRQALHGRVEPLFHGFDDGPCIHAITHDHDAAHGFALAIEFGDAAAHVGAELHVGDFAEQDRRAARSGADRDFAQVVHRRDVAFDAEDEFLLRHLHRAPAGFAVAALDRAGDLAQGDAVSAEAVGIDGDLILLHVAADGRHLGHALDAGELVFEIPILHRTQLGQVMLGRIERIHEGPAHAGRVGTKARGDVARQAAGKSAQVFEHATARPIRIGAVLKNNIHEGVTVK